MVTDDKTGIIISLDNSDIGSSVQGALVEVRKVFYVSSDGKFISFAAGNFSCVSRLGIPVTDKMKYRISGIVKEYKGKASLELSSIESADEEEEKVAQALRFIEFMRDRSARVADKEMAELLSDRIADEILSCDDKTLLSKYSFKKAEAEDIKSLRELIAQDPDRNLRVFELVKAGLTSTAIKRCRRTGLIDDDILKTNPYTMFFGGIASFAECDSLASQFGLARDLESRLEAMAISVVNDICYKACATYITTVDYATTMANMLRSTSGSDFSDYDDNLIYDAARRACNNGRLYFYRTDKGSIDECDITDEGARIASSQLYYYEWSASDVIGDLIEAQVPVPDEKEAYATMDEIAEGMGIVLDDSQRKAVYMSMYLPLCVITGGPGTGKTTIMGVLGSFFKERGIKAAFAAPTGRAAKRLSDSAGVEACTIHRLLEITPDVFNESFSFGKDSSNPIDARVIVIDEMSMVDSALFSRFLDAVAEGTSLILVGDPNQLPSVGPGNVLADLIGCREVPHIHLEYQHRSDSEGSIAANANRILESKEPVCDSDSFRVINADSEEDALKILLGLCEKTDLTDDDYVVLTPTKDERSLLSTGHLNEELQRLRLKGREPGEKSVAVADGTYHVGDRVMQMRNDYKIKWTSYAGPGIEEEGMGVYNGEIGIVTGVTQVKRKKKITVAFDDGKVVDYEGESLNDISLAYAVTVHKSQGCEFDTVYILLGNVNFLLKQRRLLYTAVTRGRNKVIIIDAGHTLPQYLNNTRESVRPSSLGDFLKIVSGGY
ncbi:MAG: AAA family ATPase [Clostridiales bacterium]|nr:AAA family ATPase [Clostridiales bacterium]